MAKLESVVGIPWWQIENAPGSVQVTKEEAGKVYYATLSAYDAIMRNDKEQKFLRTLVASSGNGTLADRVSALTTLTRQSGLMSLPYIKKLIGMLQKANVRESLLALDALKSLYATDLLPSTRKLRLFDANEKLTVTQQAVRFFEDSLKASFAAFVQVLTDLFNKQSLPVVQSKIAEASFELLRAKPEQEKALLTLLVTGLSLKVDQKAVPGKVNLLLRKLCSEHERMKEAIVNEVRNQHFVAKGEPKEFLKAVYYPCLFLYGIGLNEKNDGDVAALIVQSLIHVVVLAGQDNTKDEYLARLTRIALEALQRAFSIAVESSVISSPISEDTSEALLRLTYSTDSPGLAVAILFFLFKATTPFKDVSPNLLRAVFHHCGNFGVFRSTAALPFVSFLKELLEKAVPLEAERLAYVRRLVQTVMHVGDPAIVMKATELLTGLKDAWGGLTTEGEYKSDARDAVHASADQQFPWESLLLKAIADERVTQTLLKKRKADATFNMTDLLGDIIQPERASWEFSKRHLAIQAVLPKRKTREDKAEDDDEPDADMLEDLEEDGDDIPDLSDLEDEDEQPDDEAFNDEDFGASLDGSDLEEPEEDDETVDDDKHVAKAKMLRKKFGRQMYVSADDIEQYL